MNMETDTIAAISTAVGNGGISIVRVSGPEAVAVADRVFAAKSGKRLADVPSHTIHYGFIKKNEYGVLDEVMAAVMRAPKTYTTEDIVEIDCHGGAYVTRRVLEAVIAAGARAAQPGEFTKRAYLNGRIDLTRAEAVMDVISAQNNYALETSVSQLGGAISVRIEKMRAQLLHEVAFIEAVLDDPEHMNFHGYTKKLESVLQEILTQINRLIDSFDNGRMLREGIRTVILGKPNAGKSTLLNLLSGQERAIVTEIAGTTRDILEETIQLNGLTLIMMDTAGIRQAADTVEQIGIARAKEAAKNADLILYVADASTRLDESDEEILRLLEGKKAVVLLNKQDLRIVTDARELREKCRFPVLCISAKEGEGVDALEKLLEDMFFEGGLTFNNEVFLSNVRQKEAMQEARMSLLRVKESMEIGMPEDFYTIDLMDAYESLGRVIGKSVGEDLVNEIFDSFCMGK